MIYKDPLTTSQSPSLVTTRTWAPRISEVLVQDPFETPSIVYQVQLDEAIKYQAHKQWHKLKLRQLIDQAIKDQDQLDEVIKDQAHKQ